MVPGVQGSARSPCGHGAFGGEPLCPEWGAWRKPPCGPWHQRGRASPLWNLQGQEGLPGKSIWFRVRHGTNRPDAIHRTVPTCDQVCHRGSPPARTRSAGIDRRTRPRPRTETPRPRLFAATFASGCLQRPSPGPRTPRRYRGGQSNHPRTQKRGAHARHPRGAAARPGKPPGVRYGFLTNFIHKRSREGPKKFFSRRVSFPEGETTKKSFARHPMGEANPSPHLMHNVKGVPRTTAGSELALRFCSMLIFPLKFDQIIG